MKKLMILLLSACMMAAMVPMTAFADDTTTTTGTPVYLALGDSITTGYGLQDPTACFAAKVATAETYTLDNQAVNGMDSTGLKALVTGGTLDTKIASAQLITITIGGNDLMGALYKQLATSTGATVAEIQKKLVSGDVTTMLAALSAIKTLGTNANLNPIVSAYYDNLIAITKYIRAKNPTARVLVCTQYNPYKWLASAGPNESVNLMDKCVCAINSAIKLAAPGRYNVVDVYGGFLKSFANGETSLCNASSTNLDFHPNAAGHAKIASLVEVTFAAGSKINASVSKMTRGTITSSGTATIAPNANKTYTIKAKAGYKISKIIVDGRTIKKNTTKTTYTFKNVVSDHTIRAVFVSK